MSRGIVACDGVLTHEQAQKENVGTAVDSNTSRFVERRKYTSCRLSLCGNCGDEHNQHKHPCSTKHTPLCQSWFILIQPNGGHLEYHQALPNSSLSEGDTLFSLRMQVILMVDNSNPMHRNMLAPCIFDLSRRRVAEEGVCELEGGPERGRELEFPNLRIQGG